MTRTLGACSCSAATAALLIVILFFSLLDSMRLAVFIVSPNLRSAGFRSENQRGAHRASAWQYQKIGKWDVLAQRVFGPAGANDGCHDGAHMDSGPDRDETFARLVHIDKRRVRRRHRLRSKLGHAQRVVRLPRRHTASRDELWRRTRGVRVGLAAAAAGAGLARGVRRTDGLKDGLARRVADGLHFEEAML